MSARRIFSKLIKTHQKRSAIEIKSFLLLSGRGGSRSGGAFNPPSQAPSRTINRFMDGARRIGKLSSLDGEKFSLSRRRTFEGLVSY